MAACSAIRDSLFSALQTGSDAGLRSEFLSLVGFWSSMWTSTSVPLGHTLLG